jgi:UDPglucose--hexose-1-phosphate uridylyltransferase
MSELRQDPVTHDWVIINPERARRPVDSSAAQTACPFCAGNEGLAPPAVDTIDEAGHWSVRAVPNKFPALSASEEISAALPSGGRCLTGFGYHEVIVETPAHELPQGVLPEAQWHKVLQMYLRRYRALSAADDRIRQVVLFRNHGRRAGTSLKHPHSQIVAIPAVAPETRWRLAEEIEYFDSTGGCGTCHGLAKELSAEVRLIRVTEQFITLAPFAARVPFHVQIIPRRHCAAFDDIYGNELVDLAHHLNRLLGSFYRLLQDPDYNLVFVTPPLDQVQRLANHWFIDIMPRLTTQAGFELGSRIIINTHPPETVAAQLRAAGTGN